jgi:apolipoprotein N-acyltransferase
MGDEFDYNEMDLNESYVCASWAPILGFTGITAAVVFASEFLHDLFLSEHQPMLVRTVPIVAPLAMIG